MRPAFPARPPNVPARFRPSALVSKMVPKSCSGAIFISGPPTSVFLGPAEATLAPRRPRLRRRRRRRAAVPRDPTKVDDHGHGRGVRGVRLHHLLQHHGWKVETSRRHVERRELEDLEAKIAEVYQIDAGDTVADLTAPAAVKRITDMDRLGIGHDVGMYLAYPERRGYDVEYAGRRTGHDKTDDKAVSLGDGVMVRRADPNMRGEDLLRRMPLVKVGGEASGKGKRGGGALPEPEGGSRARRVQRRRSSQGGRRARLGG